ncbi:ABC transporter ATP-binding protein [Rubrimonas cliftonensis]|uniref:ATP-binding cassette, subfamily B, MsbA n=1 Tax=Rubrimonas cliftonensis TaxID=89524 RepID=A0A1H3VIL8_9RHOB|nr:ABC transporter ATP-binding protein [Rubrimonas cliftonensis]SDZ74619.1 ATP-binding cassette, subfamily B, MsbA [Rubrimonas cliftonensis]
MARDAASQDDGGDRLLRRAWRDWLWPHRRRLALNIGLIAAFAGSNALYPEIIRRSVDALQAGDVGVIGVIAPIIVLVTALKGGLLYGHRVLTNAVMAQVEADIQTRLFRHLVDADLAWLSREPPAALASRFTADVAIMSGAMRAVVTNALRDALMVVTLFGALLWIDVELTLIVLALAPLAAWPIAAVGRRLRKLARATSERVASTSATVVESFAGVHVAKTYGMEPYLKVKTAGAFDALRGLRVRAGQAQSLIDPLMEVLAGVAVAIVIWLIGARIAAGENTLGDITGFVTALLLAAQPVRALGNLNAVVQGGLASARRVYDLLDQPAQIAEPPGAPALAVTEGAIRFEGVSFRYGEGAPALSDFTLDIPGGARVALVGRSGAGKSTVMNLIPRLYDVTEGRLLIDGRDVREVALASLRGSVAVVSQDAVIFNDTIGANIALGRPGATQGDIEAAARAAACHDFISALPGGYGAQAGERGDRLSGGQRQRVSIARAFLRDAPILLLDEATSALDAESEGAIRAALDRLSEGRTTLIIAHRLSTILDADLIAVMDRGRLVEQGRHEALVSEGGLYAMLYRMQFEGATG